MKTKKIVVDNLPYSCITCNFVVTAPLGHFGCKLTQKEIDPLSVSRWKAEFCPLEVEQVCEWIGTQKRTYILYKSPHEPPHYHGNYYEAVNNNMDERKTYIYCHVCGHKILYSDPKEIP